ncbi:IMP dehydrogenase [Candidatus Pelagibacter sp.]|nr:IMP dehydrogenase [Candidatus Pelagibacter sp.]
MKKILSFILGSIFALNLSISVANSAANEVRVAYFLEWPSPNLEDMMKKNYSKALGVPVKWTSFNTGVEMTEAMLAGDIDISYSQGLVPFINAVKSNAPIKLIDIANGYTEHFTNFIKSVRDKYPTKTIIAGNVVTADMTQELVLSGADIVKVGIGPGSVCTTRIQTGVGYPQLSAVIECADAAHGLGAHVIADGGCTCPGDVAKGFGGGADFVMLGGMLAGHDEGNGKIVKVNGEKYIEFYGSSSEVANKKHYGGLSNYRSSEGRKVRVKYRGKINDTILNILGGVRSSCTYVGAPSLKQLSKCTTFVRVSNQFNDSLIK